MKNSAGKKLSCDDLKAGGPEKVVLSGVALTIREGESLCLSGPSGSGKSVLMRTLAGVQQPAGGKLINDWSPADVCYLPAMLSFAGTAKDLEGIIFSLRSFSGGRRSETKDIRRIFGLSDLNTDRPWESLSLGERQRMALSWMLTGRGRLLFLDESSSGLDEENLKRLMRYLRTRKDLTLVVASHQKAWHQFCSRKKAVSAWR